MSIFGKQFTIKDVAPRLAIASAIILAISAQQLLLMSTSLPIVLGIIGGCVLLVAMFISPELATLFSIFMLYANVSVVFIRNGVPGPIAGVTFLLLGIPLFNYLVNRKEKFVGAVPFFLMAVYFGLALLSAIFTDVSKHSIEWLITFALEGLVLYFLIINTIRTADVLRKAIWVILIAGSLMGAVSMYQEFTKSYDNDFGGWAIVKESEINVGESDILGNQASARRVAGPIGSKNFYAQFMVVLLPLAISRFSAERSTALRVLAIAMCIPILGGTLLTYSRGAGIAAILMIFVLFALGGLRLKHLLIIGGVAFVTVMVFVPNYIYRISTVINTLNLPNGNVAEAGGSVRGRATENLATFNVFTAHPVLGVGPGQTRYYIQEASNEIGYKNLTTDRRSHNLYLEQLSDGGIIGFASYLSIVLVTSIQLWRTARRFKASQPDVFYTLIGLLASIITFQITGLFLHLSYIRYYWFLMALAESGVLIFNASPSRLGARVQQKALS